MDLLSKEVYFTGENGQGKSNLLEALYYSSYASSFRTHTDSELIKNGEKSMSLRTIYREENGNVHTTFIVIENGHKKIEKDGKIIHDRKELINTMPCVLYSHDDLDFAEGSPERRRFFLDQSLSMYDVMYIDVLRRYRRILKNRNLCLKEKKYELFDTYDIQLIMNGLEIQKKRKDAVFQFNNDAFLVPEEKELLERMLAGGKRVVFGSDAHNTEGRRPNWDMLTEKCDPAVLRASDELLEPGRLIVTAQNI